MPAPTLVATAVGASFDTTTTPQTSGALAGVQSGDLLVVAVPDEAYSTGEVYAYSSSPALTWTKQTEALGVSGSDSYTAIATAPPGTTASHTVTATHTTGAGKYGLAVTQWRSHGGVGAKASGNQTSSSVTFSTTGSNSGVMLVLADFNAAAGTTGRTWSTVNGFAPTAGGTGEVTYFTNAANYTVYIAYWPDCGAAGSKSFGVTGPAGVLTQKYAYSIVEILGTAAAASQPILVMPPRRN